jgi:hypothetical protein
MPALTIVTLVDDDGDEFPIALPGVYLENRGADIEAALQIAQEGIAAGKLKPRGELRFLSIKYNV